MTIQPLISIISEDLVELRSQRSDESVISEDLTEVQSQRTNKSIISNDLIEVRAEFEEFQNPTPGTPLGSQPVLDENDVLIIDEAQEKIGITIFSNNAKELFPHLVELGFELLGDASEFGFIEGYLPIEAISELDSLESVGLSAARPMYQPITNAGDATSQADFVQEANRVRAALPEGYNGTGLTIGVLSDSYDNLNGEAADITSGDIPNGVNVIQDLSFGGSDEGRAMAQLIHDLAPGADLAFATAFTGQAGFAANIQALADAGADVIVDDVGYLTAPFFQDGLVAQAVDNVFENNDVAYFSSAGNAAGESYESDVINFISDTDLDSIVGGTYTYYDFDTTAGVDARQSVTLGAGQRMRLSLQWDDPFFAEVDTDLDMFLIDSSGTLVDRELDDNLALDEPLEFMVFTNNSGATETYDLVIGKSTGDDPGRIKYLNIDEVAINEYYDATGSTVFAHSAATGGLAVAAIPFFDRDNPEDFSSFGPTNILFDKDGNRLAEIEVRQTPEIAAIDGTDTTFFSSDFDGNGFPNFFGTSAAAPHAAAVAALVREANPDFSAQDVYDRLESTATDITSTGEGFDNVTGFGLINAYDAVFGDAVPIAPNFTHDFEDGDLPLAYETNSTAAGRIQVADEHTPQGTNHLTLDTSLNGQFSLNEAILHVDTTNYTDLELSFDQKGFGDEDHPMSETFNGSENSDGVALSVDGDTWYRLIDLTGANVSTSYQTLNVDLSDVATTNGLTLDSDVQIKFQQYDNFGIGTEIGSDGFAFDNISVMGTLNGTESSDNLAGSDGDDAIESAAGEDFIEAGSGGDTISGGDSRDILYGEAGDDLLIGGLGSDFLVGGDGNDTLSGGTYNPTDNTITVVDGAQDSLSGASGNDVFALSSDSANDLIYDFEDGSDIIGLVSLGAGDITITPNSDNTVITLNSDNSTLGTIVGVTSGIDSSDFATL